MLTYAVKSIVFCWFYCQTFLKDILNYTETGDVEKKAVEPGAIRQNKGPTWGADGTVEHFGLSRERPAHLEQQVASF